MMASQTSFSGLDVLLSSLQNTGDVEGTLSILNVLDELLSAGTDRRIHYMISKGGSEALLTALVNAGRCVSPNYTILLPLLHLLAKVGHRDRRIGVKAEEAGAVLLTLNLLKQNSCNARRAAACLLVIQVFATSVSTANLIGANQGLDAIYCLIPMYTTEHLHTIKVSINAFATLLCTKDNIGSAVSKGYISGLLKLYDDWHNKDTQHAAIEIRYALLRCLHKATYSTTGRHAFVSHGGIAHLYHTTQMCLLSKCLECLVEPSVQLMRKCLPKIPLPLTSDCSAYCFPLPGRPWSLLSDDLPRDESNEESEDEEVEDDQEAEGKDYDDDLETDLNKLCLRPEPDRPRELLQYSRLCPEFFHDFQELELSSEAEESSAASSSSDDDTTQVHPHHFRRDRTHSPVSASSASKPPSYTETSPERHTEAAIPVEAQDFHSHGGILNTSLGFKQGVRVMRPGLTEDKQDEEEKGIEEAHHRTMIDRLLERHGESIPHHDPQMYRTIATKTKSIPGFSILAFPDFWGHLPPPRHESMAPRKPDIQRQKVFEDIQRFMNMDDIINKVVFDLEDSSVGCPLERPDSLRFFSQFESGNLRKAIQVRRHEFDLILNADANCCQHIQWFYFEVSNMEAGIPYRFNVINCEKSNSQFNYGMQPVLYSVKEALEGRPHWLRTGKEICYFRNHFCPVGGRRRKTLYTLTFTITFKHAEDVCYLAYHYPYTYSALKAHLNVLSQSLDPAKVFFRQQILCGTLAGNLCPVVTITACPASRGWKDLHQLRNRPYIVLTSRVHPGESNASWVMKGTLEFLCSSDPVAQSLREAFVFKIVPMLNPDGVINGIWDRTKTNKNFPASHQVEVWQSSSKGENHYSLAESPRGPRYVIISGGPIKPDVLPKSFAFSQNRCDLSGEDLNRQWCKPDPVLSPTIYHTKGFLYYLSSIGRTPLVFCDFHGHSRKKNVFLYGCSIKETLWQSGSTVDTVGLKENPGYRTIAKTLDRIAPAFSFNSCNYLVEKSRGATARVVIWREMGVLRSYTMESTYNGCNQGIYKVLPWKLNTHLHLDREIREIQVCMGVEFPRFLALGLQMGTRELQEMGLKFCQSLLSLTKDVRALYSQRLIHLIDLDHNILDHKSQNCFEDDEPPCAEEIEYCSECPVLKGSDLDSDVNKNMDKEEDDGHGRQMADSTEATMRKETQSVV